jgi:large subunit ribosomal protein L13
MKTWNAKTAEVVRKWWLVDATDKTVGRIATEIARVLRGKNKAEFTPHIDTGDFVVVINAEKVKLTGTKWEDRKHYRHSRFFGSLKALSSAQLLVKEPPDVIKEAVRGMLPKTKLGAHQFTKLKAYAGADHPHVAQRPQALNI